MKTLFFFISFIIISFSAIGQVVIHGLSSNAQLLNNKQTELNRNITTIDTLSLPFIEDFAYDSLFPSQSHWLDRNVFINQNFAINPPSVGVATFDVLDEYGFMYNTASTNPKPSDYLTSKPINLSQYTAADSIYMSFYYQPQGLGWDMPEVEDSLALQFKTGTKDWLSIWAIAGDSLKEFKQIMIPIIDTAYLKKDFQFRFFNYNSIGGNQNQEDAISNDFWNLDYIIIDTNRTKVDTTHKDIAFFNTKSSLFLNYYSVPWNHYQLSKMHLDSVDYQVKNLYSGTQSIDTIIYTLYQNNITALDSFNLGAKNILALSDSSFYFDQNDMAIQNGQTTHNIPTVLHDSTLLTVRKTCVSDNTINPAYNINNSIRFTQQFYNYYAFDDGTAESAITTVGYGSQFALKITALKEDTLRGISMFFNRYKDYGTADRSIFSLCVWDDNNGEPGDIIYQEDNHNPKYGYSNNYFSTYKFKEGVFVEDTFYIGWINDTRKVYSLGLDRNTTHNDQVFFALSSSWENITLGMPMMRAILGDNFVKYSIEEKDLNQTVQIYPNPTADIIQINTFSEKTTYIQVFNSTGSLLLDKAINKTTSLSLKEFGKGLYIIKLQNNKQSISKKVIVL